MNIAGILTDLRLLENKSIKGSGITHFYIMEVDAEDSTFNTDDLTESSSIKVLLCTDKNYGKANLTMGKDAYTIQVSDLLKYMTKNIPQLDKGDSVEFGPGYTLSDLIGEYIESELECCWCRKYEDLQRYMDGSYINESNDELSPTLSKLKTHAEEIMGKGAPFTKEELAILRMWNSYNGGKAFNAGKRNAKADNARQIRQKSKERNEAINEAEEEDETIYVGDRVRIIKSNSPRFGLAGFVQRIGTGPAPVQVKFRNVDHPVFFTMDDVRKL